MYSLKTTSSFDAAHFLHGYKGKCSNLHGHRWKVEVEICSDKLQDNEEYDGMIIDFGDLKKALKEITEKFDHSFIFQKSTLKDTTIEALKSEGFSLCTVDFRPTAENISKYIFDELVVKGYDIKSVTVYETPNNCATYSKEVHNV